MTTAADDSAVEAAFAAVLAGRPVPEQGAEVAAFTEAVRSSASSPGRPNAALADLLANGLLTDQPSPSTRTASVAGRPRAARARMPRRIAMFFPALLAKILSAGAVAQAATGAGIVFVAFTGAGAAGVLPDSLQHGFATVAQTVGVDVDDPLPGDEQVVPRSDPAPESIGGEDADPTQVTSDDTTGVPAEPGSAAEWAEHGPAVGQSFGDWVSEGARNGWADGQVISEWAHEKHVDWPGTDQTATAPEDDAATDAATDTDTDTAETAAGSTRTPGSHGNGHGGSAGGSGGPTGNAAGSDGSAGGNGHGSDGHGNG